MQVPAPFEYARAGSVAEAIALLEEHGEDARLIAGGHSLLPMMKLRLAAPSMLIDINDLDDLTRIRVDGDTLRIGAMVRHAEVLASAVVGEHFRILHDAETRHRRPDRSQPRDGRGLVVSRRSGRGPLGGTRCAAAPTSSSRAAAASARSRCASSRTVRSRPSSVPPRSSPRSACRSGPARAARTSKVHRCTGDYAVAAAGAIVWLDGDDDHRRGHRARSRRRRAQRRRGHRGRDPRPERRRRHARTRRDDRVRRVQPVHRPAWSRPTTSARSSAELTKRALRKAHARCRGEEH